MIYKIQIQAQNGELYSWVGDPDLFSLYRSLEKCEIKSFEISQLPLKK